MLKMLRYSVRKRKTEKCPKRKTFFSRLTLLPLAVGCDLCLRSEPGSPPGLSGRRGRGNYQQEEEGPRHICLFCYPANSRLGLGGLSQGNASLIPFLSPSPLSPYVGAWAGVFLPLRWGRRREGNNLGDPVRWGQKMRRKGEGEVKPKLQVTVFETFRKHHLHHINDYSMVKFLDEKRMCHRLVYVSQKTYFYLDFI